MVLRAASTFSCDIARPVSRPRHSNAPRTGDERGMRAGAVGPVVVVDAIRRRRPMRSTARRGQTYDEEGREGTHHEADDHHARLSRRGDAGTWRPGRATAAAASSAADGRYRSSTTRPRRPWSRQSGAPTRSCSAARPTTSSPAPGEPAPGGQIRATTRSQWLSTRSPSTWRRARSPSPEWDGTTVLSGDVAAAVAEVKAKPGRTAGARQRCPGPGAARERPGRRDQPVHLSAGRRPGHAAVPRHRPGQSIRTHRIAKHAGWGDHPGLPAGRAPGLRVGRAEKRLIGVVRPLERHARLSLQARGLNRLVAALVGREANTLPARMVQR